MENQEYTKGILDEIKVLIRGDISVGAEKSQIDYLDRCLEKLKRRYQIINKWSRYKAWSISDRREISQIWMEFKPLALETIEEYTKKCKSRKLTKEINSASAKMIIKAAMSEAGLKYKFEGQAHRAKIMVLLTQTRYATTYITYKKLNQELPGVIESFKVIKSELEKLGNQTSINKTYDFFNWE